jgi:hypothetical protein
MPRQIQFFSITLLLWFFVFYLYATMFYNILLQIGFPRYSHFHNGQSTIVALGSVANVDFGDGTE